ncbi:MAG: hypothetical protein M1826_005914 [Phylliscum demangeonii]|nr:MAG: hypothetical protein M1826_005914 [Phylliscum demangeonii]
MAFNSNCALLLRCLRLGRQQHFHEDSGDIRPEQNVSLSGQIPNLVPQIPDIVLQMIDPMLQIAVLALQPFVFLLELFNDDFLSGNYRGDLVCLTTGGLTSVGLRASPLACFEVAAVLSAAALLDEAIMFPGTGWQPQEEPLKQLAACLKDSLSGHNQAAQKAATAMLAEAKNFPDINNYLTYLFICPQPPPPLSVSVSVDDFHTARCAAAIMLKNDLRDAYETIPESNLAYLRSSVLAGLQDPNPQIRNLAGNVITEVVRQGGVLGWQQLLPELLAMVDNADGRLVAGAQEGAMSALAKVCDDNKKALDRDYQGQRPLNVIVPKLLSFTSSPLPKVRASALGCLNVFIPSKSPVVTLALDAILERLFQLANDPGDDVRRNVCRAIVLIVEIQPEKIAPYMGGLVDYILTQQANQDDPDLALDAAEFWLCVGEHDTLRAGLGPYLPKVIPALLQSMVYSQDEIMMLEGASDDADEEDKAEDIKPKFASTKAARITAAGGAKEAPPGAESASNGTAAALNAAIAEADDNLSEGEIDEYDLGDGDEDPEDKWNLRKCSAAALDVLASVFHDQIFDITLPYLKENLRHSDWPQREAAVLALGAVAEGCMDVVTPHLPELVPYLISLLADREAVVRQITCWTLGRYSGWAAQLEVPAQRATFFEPMVEGLLTKMLDNNKRVQEAGASAFATLEEKATTKMIPYCEPIVRQFVHCFAKYQDRNMFILYDCVQTLAEHVGPALAAPAMVDLLMPALIERWNKVDDHARELFPLLECLSYVAMALGGAFTPFALPVFGRCMRIVHENLEQHLAAINNDALEKPEKDFLITSLDLLSALVQVLEPGKSVELITNTQPPLFDLLSFCMKDANNDVRHSAYALLGDCAIYVSVQLASALPTLLPILVRQLDLDQALDEHIKGGFGVINNACWATGEICYRQPHAVDRYVEELYQRLSLIILSPDVPESVHENAAIALGRLGLGAPQKLAPHVRDFAEAFLDAIEKVDFTEEKDSAFEGFAKVVGMNPQAMDRCLPKYFEAIARYKIVVPRTQRLRPLFFDTIVGYRSMLTDFDGFVRALDPKVQEALRASYNI